MKWLDTRIHKPSTNGYSRYTVIFQYEDLVLVGTAAFMPKNNYTDGDWEDCRTTNGNALGGEVLYYMENPKLPEWLIR